MGLTLITGMSVGSIAIVFGSLCGLSLVYLVKFIWFLELVSYFVFINANFGSTLSNQHKTIYDWVHFDFYPHFNELWAKVRDYEQAYFFRGKFGEMKVSAFITINSNLEYLPNLIILFLSSLILIIQRFGSTNKRSKRINYSKVTPLNE